MKSKNIIVISKGDWGFPHPKKELGTQFRPVDKKKSSKGDKFWGFWKGHEYEYLGEEANLKDKKGWGKLFQIKGSKE